MSEAGAGGGPGSREVAYRLFAAEYDDATFEYSESDEERAPKYVITPTGARVNRLFVVGVLTEVESVSDEVLRARVVDPTGAFVVYAGQYQPDAHAFLDRSAPPAFVALTGKARTYSPDGSDRIFTSVRPESITVVDGDTRDRWTVQAAEQTLDRAATMAAALERPERGADLEAVLREAGVAPGLVSGIPLAIDHYGTTSGYLSALRTVAVQAVEVITGDRTEVEPLDRAPDEGADDPVAFAVDLGDADPVADDVELDASEVPEPGPVTASTGEPAAAPGDEESAEPPAAEDEPRFELDDTERQAVEEEFGTEFTAGTEVDEPGEADIDGDTEPPTASTEPDAAQMEGPTVDEPVEPADVDATAPTDESPAGVDLETAVVDAMRDLDEGDGAPREAVIESVSDAHNVAETEVADAIDEALMSGKCYEPTADRLTAI